MQFFPFLNHFRRRYYIRRAIYIALSWTLVSIVLFFYEYSVLESSGNLSTSFDFTSNLTATAIVGITAGLLGGLFTINLMEGWLRRYPFFQALLYIFLAYTATAIIVTLCSISYLRATEMNLPIYNLTVIKEVFAFFGTFFFLRNYLIWLLIVIFTLIILMVNDKYGPGVLRDFLLGKYFHPKKEERIFMFIDVRSATTIAEEIGEERYFNFLKDFFKDITPAIIYTRGEVYQYVGDEVVVTWKLKNGLYKINVLRCYFEMKRLIRKRKKKYLKKYGAYPDFKVGAHYGQVMTGEVGILKREIAFSGDTLNTASRIQALCNDHNVDILLSKKLVEAFPYLPYRFQQENIGRVDLKGKTETLELITFTLSS
ncbi:MAG TPA: adenylate/guanylate cyclase domain-containing protein [Leeuwenhoekiella sp.]|nr:adenylate/guanylate cyclase domain-containing protein [Leeuwenhoekiella sp.]